MSSPFFSVIVPVYNDDKNLPRCLESIALQTFGSFECLLINDGSTDNSPVLCDKYAEKDVRFSVFHKKNEGTSKTRQFGINNATGVFTIFIDSDDWIESEFLFKINRKLEGNKIDIIFLDFIEENTNGKQRYYCQKPTLTETDVIIRLVLEGKLFSCLWNVVLKRELYFLNKVNFIEGINYGEDSLFIMELLLNKPKTDYLAGAYYHHTQNPGSFTRKNVKNRLLERIHFLEQLTFLLKKYERNDLNINNFFPFNDKYEMLSSGEFSKNEYHSLFPLSFTSYFRKQVNFTRYFLLVLAETRFYYFAKSGAVLIKKLKLK